MKKMKNAVTLLIIICSLPTNLFSQEKSLVDMNFGTDLASRYVWRGIDYGRSPSIQPYLSFSLKNVEIGSWGAFTTNLPGLQETDIYLSYAPVNFLSFKCTDYFFPDDKLNKNKYFDYANDKTTHLLEMLVSFSAAEFGVPLDISGGTVFYGADKINLYDENDPQNTEQNFSTYFEMVYSTSVNSCPLNAFLGFTTHEGLYGTGFGVVNIGISGTKTFQFENNFGIGLTSSLIVNPQLENIHLVFVVSL